MDSRRAAAAGAVALGALWAYRRHKATAAAAAAPVPGTSPGGFGPTAATGAGPGPVSTYVNPMTGMIGPRSDAQWTVAALNQLGRLGFDPVTVAAALTKYENMTCLSATEADLVRTANAYLGPPPVGNYPVKVC